MTLDFDAIIFQLKFKATGGNGSQSEIKIVSEPTISEAYNENLDLLSITSTNGMVTVGDGSSIANHPSSIIKLQVQPNPFAKSTKIIFSIPQDETVTLSIYDIVGREVNRVKADYKAGGHQIEWSGDDDNGKRLSRGLYHVRMMAGEYTGGIKVILAR